ncbi:MAG TPA: Nif3-like dinuclear metal center hexameric protein [Polyangiaceae bacterium]|nr:Nif3-like dinuclear metal center hexameric protein [Polyangiaceae bacterium]
MGLPLSRAVELLSELAPLRFAESWDNVGLLLGVPPAGATPHHVERALCAIDLTHAVLDEAIARRAGLIVAYHPPLFAPLKKLDGTRAGGGPLLRAAAERIAVYSPHTALDAAPGGVNDWLASGVGAGECAPLVDAATLEPSAELKLVTFVPPEHADKLRTALAAAGAGVIGEYSQCSTRAPVTGTFLGSARTNPTVGAAGTLETVAEMRLEMVCPERALGAIARAMRDVHPYEEPAWDVYPLAPRPTPGFGMGRSVALTEPLTLTALVDRLKAHLGRTSLRVAATAAHRAGNAVRRVAACAGSGKSVFDRAPGFDVYVTGELGHHAVLAHLAAGESVILAEHSSTERGYLRHYATRITEQSAGTLEALVSETDREPLEVW